MLAAGVAAFRKDGRTTAGRKWKRWNRVVCSFVN